MRNLLLIAVLAFVAWRWYAGHEAIDPSLPQPSPTPADMSYPGTLAPAPKTRAQAGSTELVTQEFETMFDGEQRLETLAKPGHYTVVEVYLDSCPICRQLEATYPAFLAARQDVVIRKVHASESGMNLQFSGATREEVEAQVKHAQAWINAFAVCGTPHVEVYGPDGAILAADRCGAKDGLNYLRDWIRDETGVDAGSGSAFTPTR